MSTAVITGAAGFVGRAFAAALAARGWTVRGVDVRPGPRVTIGDITRVGPWTDLLGGADLLVHAAAIVSESGDERTFWRVNVDGTRTVLEQSEAAGVPRVLHLSSKVVHGGSFPDGIDETGPVRMTGNPYTDTKVAGEHQALLYAAARRVPVTILRPGDVYGPHSVPWTVRPVELLRRGRLFLLGGGTGILAPLYIDDLVGGGLAAADSDAAVGEVFHLHGGAGVEVREFFGHYADMLGVGLRSLPGPSGLLAGPAQAIARSLGRQPPLSPQALEYLSHRGVASIAKAERVLGWTPAVSLEEGMARTRVWLEEIGLVPSEAGAEAVRGTGDAEAASTAPEG